MLMIFDESQTGLGKTGKLFGFQHEDGVQPDIITISTSRSEPSTGAILPPAPTPPIRCCAPRGKKALRS
jgi:hypothetical protein